MSDIYNDLDKDLNKDLDKVIKIYESEIKKDAIQIERDKRKFINTLLNTKMGEDIKDIKTYIKPEPSKLKVLWQRLKFILWSE